MRTIASVLLAASFGASLGACRDASGGGSNALVVIPNPYGANGCSGPDQTFTLPQSPVPVALTVLVIGPESQMTADSAGGVLYATGVGASVIMLDVSVDPPNEVALVPAGVGPGTVAELLAAVGIPTAPVLSGIAVLDADHLILVEQTSNTLITVERMPPNVIAFYAGQPNETPGFADGLGQGGPPLARFSFGTATQICPSGSVPAQVFVADSGNHSVRVVQRTLAGFLQVTTIAGNGSPASSGPLPTSDLSSTFFDTPTGLSAACSGALVVSERGGNGFGNLVRQLEIGQPSVFGGFLGTATTLAGDGFEGTTQGIGGDSQVAGPVSPLVTREGEIYWIDSGKGVLRRRKLDGEVDCPLATDCTAAVLAPSFPPSHAYCLTQTASGILFVMDATDGILYRVTP